MTSGFSVASETASTADSSAIDLPPQTDATTLVAATLPVSVGGSDSFDSNQQPVSLSADAITEDTTKKNVNRDVPEFRESEQNQSAVPLYISEKRIRKFCGSVKPFLYDEVIICLRIG